MKSIWVCLGISFFSLSLSAQLSDFEGLDFARADSVAALYPKHSLLNTKYLADKLTKPFTTEVEKFRAIYTWVCNNITIDYTTYVRNKYKRQKLQNQPEKLDQWNHKLCNRVFDKLLHEHKSVCTGYAYLVKELAFHAGLTCEIIHGYGRSTNTGTISEGNPNHSWNAVEIDNKWYLCDATWSSGMFDLANGKFVTQFNDAYFLAAPDLFIRNHYPLSPHWILLENKPALHKFLNGPFIYAGAFQYGIHPVHPERFSVTMKRGEVFSIRFCMEGEPIMEQVSLKISRHTAHPKVYQVSEDVLGIDHVFDKKGTHVVHLLVNSEYISTYSVRVLN